MKNAKLIDLLKSFTKEEFKDLSAFIEYTKVKDNTQTLKLFLYLYKYYPTYEEKFIEKERVYRKLYADKKYDENKLAKIMTDLTKIIEEFIITRQSKSNELANKIQLLKFYNKNDLQKYYIQLEKEIKVLLNEHPLCVMKTMYEYEYKIISLVHSIKKDIRNPDYQSLYNCVHEFYEIQKLRWYNLNYTSMMPELVVMDKNELLNNNLYKLHYLIYKLFNEKNEDYFTEILSILSSDDINIEKIEKNEIYWVLVSYALENVNQGFINHYDNLFNIYDIIDKNNSFLNMSNHIDVASYKNYITVSLKLKKIENALYFLEKYKDNIPLEIKNEIYNFNKALILFEKKEYSTVIDLLMFCKFSDVFYKLNQRRLIIKTYYELLKTDNTYYSIIEDAIVAFKKYLLSIKDVPESYIVLNKNFLKFLDKLLSRSKLSKIEITKQLIKLKETTHVTERNWLEEKMNESSTSSK